MASLRRLVLSLFRLMQPATEQAIWWCLMIAMDNQIYLDNAASTPVADDVLSEMLPFMKQQYGNPSSIHRFGRVTTRAIQLARRRVAEMIGALPQEIIFTSGGTEADNMALRGMAMHVRV